MNTSVSGYTVGGLAGTNEAGLMINCFVANPVSSGGSAVGALVGKGEDGFYIGCFYDNTINPSLTGIGDGSDPLGVTGETTASLWQSDTYLDADWPIVTSSGQRRRNTWRMCEDGIDYPYLAVEFLTGDLACPDGVDVLDLAAFSDEWAYEQLSRAVDFKADGRVNFSDWAVLAAAWYSTEESENYNLKVDIAPVGGDGVIDEWDMRIFCEYWLEPGWSFLNADIEPYRGDGDVDFADYAVFANQWVGSE